MSIHSTNLEINVSNAQLNFRIFLQEHPGKFLRKLLAIFMEADKSDEGLMAYWDFEKCLNQFGFFPSKYEIQALNKYYSRYDTNMIEYKQFISNNMCFLINCYK